MKIIVPIAFIAVLFVGVAIQPASAEARTVAAGPWHCAKNVTSGQTACESTRRAAKNAVGGKLLVRLFGQTGYNGWTVTFTGAHRCSRPYDFEYPKQGLIILFDWDNWASSVRTFNRCDVKLINIDPNPNKKSTWIDEYGNLSGLGSGWNNKTDRVRIS